MPTLAERVQALPAELFDEIWALALTSDREVEITKYFKPPRQLQINKSTRAIALHDLYATTTFTFDLEDNLIRWLKSLSPNSLALVYTIHCDHFGISHIDFKSAEDCFLLDRMLGAIYGLRSLQSRIKSQTHLWDWLNQHPEVLKAYIEYPTGREAYMSLSECLHWARPMGATV